MKKIQSLENPRIKKVARLKKARERKKQGKFLIEGYKEVKTALAYGVNIEQLYYCPELADKELDVNLEENKIIQVTPEIFNRICYRDTGDGFLVVAPTYYYSLNDINHNQEDIIPVLENVEKPGNLGAVIRTAVSAGINTLIVNEMQTDIFNPNVLRSSLGGFFGVKVVEASKEETYSWLQENGYSIYVTTAHASKKYTEADYINRFSLILGSEKKGVSNFWKERGDNLLVIPMQGEISSLNISVAAGIVMFEAKRQKGFN